MKKKLITYLKNPFLIIPYLGFRGCFHWIPDELYLKILFRIKMGYKLDLKNPKTFNEKLQWLKLNDRKELYTQLVDKYEVRQYIEDTIGKEYLIPLLGVWDRFEDIDFDLLPEQFVLKTTHDSGGIVICKDKSKLDKENARKVLEAHLKSNHWKKWREWAYKNVKPQIIAEMYMSDSARQASDDGEQLTDYKFFCFDGEPKMMFIATDRFAEDEVKFDFFDMEYNHLPFRNQHPNAEIVPACPECFEEMK